MKMKTAPGAYRKPEKTEGASFGEVLRSWRKYMGVKNCVKLAARARRKFEQSDAAAFFGVPLRTYQGWERRAKPKVPVAVVKAAVLKKIDRTYRERKVRYE